MNKLLSMGTVMFASMLLVAGCGNMGANADKDNREEADIITDQEKEGGNRDTGDAYGFNNFNLEIDVNNEDAVDAEYKVEEDFKPEYENKMTKVDLEGAKAMDELDKMFIATNLESNMSGEEARDKILEYFQIDEYSKFELEIEFDDGKNLNYKDQQ